MRDTDAKQRLMMFLKVGLPYTIGGMIVIFAGIWGIKHFFSESRYLTLLLFGWLAVFWFIYQPLFRSRMNQFKRELSG